MVFAVVAKYPQLFGLNPADTLAPKLAWFISQGYNNSTMSKMLFLHPRLLGYTIARNKRQLLGLQAMGFSQPDVFDMIKALPTLLMLDISSSTTQDKLKFLTEVMAKSVQELLKYPTFLGLSLVHRIVSRWAFFCLHCPEMAIQPQH